MFTYAHIYYLQHIWESEGILTLPKYTQWFSKWNKVKGALDNFSLIPRYFFQKSWDFYAIRSVYLSSDCLLNLTYNLNLITKVCTFFLQQPFFKVYFLKMTATVVTVEFGTIHHYSSLEQNSDACLCSSLNRYKD